MARQELKEVLEELEAWLPSETAEFVEIVGRVLVSLPGGDALDGLFEPLALGWKETELLGKLLLSLRDSSDVEEAVRRLFGCCEECEEEG